MVTIFQLQRKIPPSGDTAEEEVELTEDPEANDERGEH